MNPIDTYLDTAFSSLPATHEAIEARNDIRILMLDKHEELTSQGMDEKEAYEKVVSEFGDISEVAYALGLGEFVDGTNPIDNKAIRLDEPRAQAYIEHRASRGRKIGLGVGILGLYLAIISGIEMYYEVKTGMPFENLNYNPLIENTFSGLFLLALGIALYLFLSNPYKTEKYFVTKMPLALTRKTKESIEAKLEKRGTIQRIRLITGISLSALGFIMALTFGARFTVTDDASGATETFNLLGTHIPPLTGGILEFSSAVIFFVGIYLLIIRGVERKAYKALLK